MASNRGQSSANANNASTKRMSTPGSSASGASGTPASATTTPGVNPDKAIARLLYAMLKQKSLKDIDWNQVASDPVLLEGISNGHAARMRYSRFRNAVENSKSTKRQPKGSGAKSCKVTKRKSVGARHVMRDEDSKDQDNENNENNEDNDDKDEDADGDTEVDDDDDQYTGKGKENRGQSKVARKISYKSAEMDNCGQARAKTMAVPAKVLPKEDPEIMDVQASASFSSLPSPPMEAESNVDFSYMDESPLIGQQHLFQSAAAFSAAAVPSNDRLVVLKKRKTNMHSPTMDMETALHQIPQVPQVQVHPHSQAHRQQIHGYGLSDLSVGLGLSTGPARIHSMPLLHTTPYGHHNQHSQNQHMSNYSGGAMMMRHHSAGSLNGLADINQVQVHQPHQGHQGHQGHFLGQRPRLLTPSSDDILQKQMSTTNVDDYLAFGSANFSAVSKNQNQNQSVNDSAATPHTQWTTPFASPLLEDSLDAGGLDMSPYIGSGMDFSAASGADGMDPMMSSIDPGTSLFAMVDDQPQVPRVQAQNQAQANQQYMAAFAKHSSNWDAMISQGPHA